MKLDGANQTYWMLIGSGIEAKHLCFVAPRLAMNVSSTHHFAVAIKELNSSARSELNVVFFEKRASGRKYTTTPMWTKGNMQRLVKL